VDIVLATHGDAARRAALERARGIALCIGLLAGRVTRQPEGTSQDVGAAAAVLAIVSAVVTAAIVLGLFVWAARKDGRYDRELQRRLGIRRRTRL